MMLSLRYLLPRSQNFIRTSDIYLHRFLCEKVSECSYVSSPLPIKFRRFIVSSAKESTSQERVYYGSLTPRMKVVKVFSLTTSLAGLAAQPILLEQGMQMGGVGLAAFLCGFGGFFTFVTPLLLHFITKKYVTEIYFNPKTNEYTATTISLFLMKIQTKFQPSDVKVPDVPGMFTSFLVRKKPLFVDPSLFQDTEHYIKMMGYDRPIDFKLNLPEPPTTAKEDKRT